MEQNDIFVHNILKERYLLPYENTWEDLCRRVSRVVASAGTRMNLRIDQIRKDEITFYNLMESKTFLPNSPTLFNAGRGIDESFFENGRVLTEDDYKSICELNTQCFSACFVIPIEDSMEGICDCLKQAALVTKFGGGVGIDFSTLRPKDSLVASTGKISSGVVPFMQMFDAAAHAIKQGGLRRGAFMGILDYDHPDILEFIHSKEENTGDSVLSYFNLSVDIDHEKMIKALENDEYIELRHAKSGSVKKIKADRLLYIMAEAAWKKGCPGIYMSSKQNKYFACSESDPISSTNACGEQGLVPYGNCTLGHINMRVAKQVTPELVSQCIRFLDNVVEINAFPVVGDFEKTNKQFRNVGLGVMGVADWLLEMGKAYDAPDSHILLSKELAKLCLYSYTASMMLAKERGVCPKFKMSRWQTEKNFYPIAFEEHEDLQGINSLLKSLFAVIPTAGLRNIMVNTIAPTGTTAILAGCSSGIEPHYAFGYERNVVDSNGVVNSYYLIHDEIKKAFPSTYEEVLMDSEKLNETVYMLTKNPLFKTAHDISPIVHMTMQHFAQSYIDNSISKTINIANNATISEVYEIFKFAIYSNCKGITVYRDGSYAMQVLQKKKFEGRSEIKRFEFGGDTFYLEYFVDAKVRIVSLRCSNSEKYKDVISFINATSMQTSLEKIFKNAKGSEFMKKLSEIVDSLKEPDVASETELQTDPKGFMYDGNGVLYCPSCKRPHAIVFKEGCISCKYCDWGACV